MKEIKLIFGPPAKMERLKPAAHTALKRPWLLRRSWLAGSVLLLLLLLAGCGKSGPALRLTGEESGEQLQSSEKRLLGWIEQNPKDGKILRQLARIQLRLGKMKAAEENALRAAKLSPFQPAGYEVLGLIYLKNENLLAALSAFEQASALNPEYVPAHIGRARVYEAMRNPDKALFALRQALSLAPGHFGAKLLQARVLLGTGKMAEAETAIQEVRRLHPADRVALRLHAEILRAAGKSAPALLLLDSALGMTPPDPSLLGMAVLLYKDRENWAAAGQMLSRLEKLRSLTPVERLHRVEVLAGLKQATQADEALTRLIADYPEFAAANTLLGQMRIAEGKDKQALEPLDASLALAPNAADSAYWKAVAHFNMEEHSAGEASLAISERMAPGHPAPALLRIEHLIAASRDDAAEAGLLAFDKAHPKHPASVMMWSTLSSLRGDLLGAARHLARVGPAVSVAELTFAHLRLDYLAENYPQVLERSASLLNHPRLGWRAAYLRAEALWRLNRAGAALAALAPYLENPHHVSRFHYLTGYLHLLRGDKLGAERVLFSGLGSFPKDPLLLEGLSRVAMEMGNRAEARKYLEQGLGTPGPHHLWFLERLALLSQVGGGDPDRKALRRFLSGAGQRQVMRSPGAGLPSAMERILFGNYIPAYPPPR